MKIFLALLTIALGGAGLVMTACGTLFISSTALGLIGILPGIVLIWLAFRVGNRAFAPESPASNEEQNQDPPAAP